MNCKACGEGPFNGPQAVAKHRLAAHAELVKREKLRKKRERSGARLSAPPPPDPEHDAETELVIASSRMFADAGLDAATNSRVITYLHERFGALETE